MVERKKKPTNTTQTLSNVRTLLNIIGDDIRRTIEREEETARSFSLTNSSRGERYISMAILKDSGLTNVGCVVLKHLKKTVGRDVLEHTLYGVFYSMFLSP